MFFMFFNLFFVIFPKSNPTTRTQTCHKNTNPATNNSNPDH